MYKTLMLVTTVALVCVILTGCSQETLDSRQIDTTGGLAYKHGSNDPFTGIVAFKDTIPSDLEGFWTTNIASATGHPVEQVLSGCQERYVKGLPDGEVSCEGTGGHKALVLHYANEQLDGRAKLYNADTGELVQDQVWSKGKLDGTVKTYTYDGKQLIGQAKWKDGLIDGAVKQWNSRGDLITEAVYKAGQIDSGHLGTDNGLIQTSMEFQNGKPNGTFSKVSEAGELLQKGQYVDGLREGSWEDHGEDITHIFAQFISGVFDVMPVAASDLANAARIDSHWTQGKADGEMRGSDKDGKQLFVFRYVNGVMDGPNQSVMTPSGSMQAFNVKAGKLVADPAAASSIDTASRSPEGASTEQPSAASSFNAPAEALAGSVQIPGSGNACLDEWETAYRKERGDDAVIAYDQIGEWTEECKQGKTAPKN